MELLPEVEVWYALPAIRRRLAQALVEHGLTQKDVANRLDTAPSAVSQYLSGKRGKTELPDSLEQRFSAAAERIAEGADASKEIMALTETLRETRIICDIHREHSSDVPDGCACCFD